MSTESAERIAANRRIEEAASQWLARRDSGAWSPQDEAAFEHWMNESTLHRVAYLRLENGWEEALRLKALGAGVRSHRPPPAGQWNLSPFFRRSAGDAAGRVRKFKVPFRAVAGSVICALVLGASWYLRSAAATYETSLGAVASLPMPDGSKVILNTDSEIKVLMSETERRIDLKHGEAFFEVAKDARRPFVVRAGDKRVIAVGTRFSVRRQQSGATAANVIRIIVTEGAVRVESVGVEGTQTILAPRLAAGSVVRAGKDLSVQSKRVPEAEEQLAWRIGVVVFRNTSLDDAAAEFNRYNERKIRIGDPAAAALRVAGSFRTTNVEAFVRLLEQGHLVKTEARDGEIILSAR